LLARLDGLALLCRDAVQERTNLGLYRLYLDAYFRKHASVRQDRAIVIRQVQSSEPAVAIEVYLYVNETSWERYERLQSDMLDHAYGVVPSFGLHCWRLEFRHQSGSSDAHNLGC
jgi:miniconductance mechanosensitive channel